MSLKEKYENEIVNKLMKELKIDNIHAVPKLQKIVVNSGMGEVIKQKDAIEKMAEAMAVITGQKPRINKAQRAISNFKIQKGMPIGLSVTLRREKMWSFLEKLIKIVLPRIKDFRGVSKKSFDGNGNYSIGLEENTVFPEINPNKIDKVRGLQINIVTSAENDEHGLKLLEMLGVPFKKDN